MAVRSAFGRRQRRMVEVAILLRPQYSYTGVGGAISGGAAIIEAVLSGISTYVYEGVGGASAGGSAARARTWVEMGQGGASSGGAALTTFQPAGAVTYVYTGGGGASSGGSAATTDTYAMVYWAALEVPAS